MCILHFDESSIRRHAEGYDTKTGKKLIVPLERPRLHKGAIPSILPGCPAYLSRPSSSRESREEKLLRLENQQLEQTIVESLCSKEIYDKKTLFTSYDELIDILKNEKLPEKWHIIYKESSTFIISIMDELPIVTASIVVDQNLNLKVYVKDAPLNQLGKHNFPLKVNSILVINEILNNLNLKSQTECTIFPSIIDSVISLLDNLNVTLDDSQKTTVQFIIEQLKLLLSSKFCIRYSSEILVFCSILYSISPHAYKFLRNSGFISIPHPRTLQKLCSSLNTNPQIEQSPENFLHYIKTKMPLIKSPADKTVIMMIDEIHIKPYLDYKGGNIVGAAYNNENAANSAYVFMLQSLLSSFKEVVHIMPVKTLDSNELHKIIRKTIIGLHGIGFKVIGVVSDNNSINRKAMHNFSSPPTLCTKYEHPCDQNSPLFFLIDSVHLLKCIRNNWINQKNENQCFIYPDFDNSNKMCEANFATLKHLHEIECHNIVKYAKTLTLKSLSPTSMEKQNVKLALKIFDESVYNSRSKTFWKNP